MHLKRFMMLVIHLQLVSLPSLQRQLHGLLVGQEVKLAGIAFTCDYLPAVGVQSAVYDNTTGIMTVTTSSAHGLSVTGSASDVVLSGLAFTCALDWSYYSFLSTNK